MKNKSRKLIAFKKKNLPLSSNKMCPIKKIQVKMSLVHDNLGFHSNPISLLSLDF